MRFCIVRAIQIQNGYNLSGWMKRAQNSDSKTHVKKQNLNSRTEIRQKSLKYLYLETPCMIRDRGGRRRRRTGVGEFYMV